MRPVLIVIAYVVVGLALYNGFIALLGPEGWRNFKDFMFGPYIELYDKHYRDMMPGWGNPFVAIITITFACLFLWNWFSVSQIAASLILGIFLFDLGFWLLDPVRGIQPEPNWFLYAFMSIGWLIFAHAVSETLFWAWLRDKRDGRI